jgi:hypothetical protein
MGREAEGHARWQGQDGQVRALLESHALILRGDIRATLPRHSLSDWRAEGEVLTLLSSGTKLELTLGAAEAARWVVALSRPLPSLEQKLGLGPDARGFVTGDAEIPELTAALTDATAATPAQASLLIAILSAPADLVATLTLATTIPALPVWCVHGKGRTAVVTDAMVRTAFRGTGYMDTKTSGVNADWTATRYGKSK